MLCNEVRMFPDSLSVILAKDGEGALSFQPLLELSRSIFWGLMEAKWPIR